MRTIWKFPFDVADEITIEMPKGAKVVHVGPIWPMHNLWAIVDTEAPLEERKFSIRGTGHPLPPRSAKYVGTWWADPFVWHLFEW
jgi:hypothetical protein